MLFFLTVVAGTYLIQFASHIEKCQWIADINMRVNERYQEELRLYSRLTTPGYTIPVLHSLFFFFFFFLIFFFFLSLHFFFFFFFFFFFLFFFFFFFFFFFSLLFFFFFLFFFFGHILIFLYLSFGTSYRLLVATKRKR